MCEELIYMLHFDFLATACPSIDGDTRINYEFQNANLPSVMGTMLWIEAK